MNAHKPTISQQDIVEICRDTLNENWRDSFTIPAKDLYPHQWLWDSCFIAIGLSTYAIERAQTELRNLLRGQWSNGMLPHMIFAEGDKNKTDRRLWQSWRNPHAPDDVSTSGITQPPVLAESVLRIGKRMKTVEMRGWYQDMLPSLISYHEWLYAERDPHDEGLIFLIHPWESGLDNSPPWIKQLHKHSRPWWVSIIEQLRLHTLINTVRRDTRHVPPGQRLDAIDSILYYSVLLRLRRKNWDIDRILPRSHFTLQDITFNSILARSNSALIEIAEAIGHEIPLRLLNNVEKTRSGIEKLWDGYYGQYFSREFTTHKLIKESTIGALMPLYAGTVPKEKAHEIVNMLYDKQLFKAEYPIPTVPFSSEHFSELGYWQGPTWINTNWMVIQGLHDYGFTKEAEHITNLTIELVKKHGPYEYFSPITAQPAGAEGFSWTAALVLDLIASSQKHQEGRKTKNS